MTDPDESLIVERYRALPRILPPSYRPAREEEMVAAFAEGMGDTEEERLGRPAPGETASVVALAVRLWFGGVGAPPRLLAFGQTVRLYAVLGVLAQAVLAAAGALGLLTTVFFGSDEAREVLRTAYGESGSIDAAARVAWHLLDLLWIPVYVAVVRGHRRAARLLAVLAAVPPLLRWAMPFVWPWHVVILALATVLLPAPALAVAFHRDAPAVRPLGGLAALPVGAVAVFAVPWLVPSLIPDPDGVCCWVALGTGVVCLLRSRSSADGEAGHRSAAVALYATLVLIVRLSSTDVGDAVPYADLIAYGQAAALLVLACALAVRTAVGQPWRSQLRVARRR
ncbi:hypothetical protein [Actinoallomurus sp. CA-142502]|uniref:hypothetical protein n=1 Tax=Actinoallomurus sp. CA-142502 TaxID=3239885 RepID=UPI003D8EA799